MFRDYERSTSQKVILCLLAAMAVLFAVGIGISRNFGGVQFDEMFMKVTQEGTQTIYTGKQNGEEVTVICYEENGVDVVDFTVGDRYHTLGQVEYPDGTITTKYGLTIPRIRILRDGKELFSGGYDPDAQESFTRFFTEDGELSSFIEIQVHVSTDPWYDYELNKSNIFYFANGPQLSHRGSWEIFLAALLISLIAAGYTAFPETLFYLKHHHYVRDPQPTDAYYTMHAFSSVVLSVMALVLYIIALRTIV